jgi:hypothetical protein
MHVISLSMKLAKAEAAAIFLPIPNPLSPFLITLVISVSTSPRSKCGVARQVVSLLGVLNLQ